MLKVYNKDDAPRIEYPDIYFTPEYASVAALAELAELAEPAPLAEWEMALFWVDGIVRIIYVYIKKPIGEYYDLASPYGYSGIHYDGEEYLSAFREAFLKYADEHRYITEFIRLNPYLGKKYEMTVLKTKKTLGIKMTDYESYFRSTKKNHQYAVKKGIRDGYKFRIRKIEETDLATGSLFRKMYGETMERKNAHPYYHFSDAYFMALSQLDGLFIASVADVFGQIIGTSLFLTFDRFIHYHLSCVAPNTKNVNNFLLDGVTRWGFQNGYEFIHLGGGVVDGDSLYRFKRSLANTEFEYRIGYNILNPLVYGELCCGNDSDGSDDSGSGNGCGTIINHFPPYRSQ